MANVSIPLVSHSTTPIDIPIDDAIVDEKIYDYNVDMSQFSTQLNLRLLPLSHYPKRISTDMALKHNKRIARFAWYSTEQFCHRPQGLLPKSDPWGRTIPSSLPFQNAQVAAAHVYTLLQMAHTTYAFVVVSEAIRLLHSIPEVTSQAFVLPITKIPVRAIKMLASTGILTPVTPTSVGGATVLHCVAEKLHTPSARFRIVADTIEHNLQEYKPSVTFCPMHQVLSRIANHPDIASLSLVTIDLKSSFHQIPLPANVNFLVRTKHGIFRYNRLPMGYVMAVDIQHRFTLAITLLAKQNLVVDYDVYVDNVLAWGSPTAIATFAKQFAHICAQTQFTIGEMLINNAVTHRGVSINLHLELISLKESWITKILFCVRCVLDTHTITSKHKDILAGMLVYADDVLNPFLARRIYYILQNYSENFLPITLASELRAATRWITTTLPLHFYKRHQEIQFACTDSSNSHLGLVLFQKSLQVISARWTDVSQSINVKELAAIRVACQRVSQPITHVFCDNVAAIGAIRRRYSKSFSMMNQLRQFTQLPTYIWYVPSLRNPADEPSRLKEFQLHKLLTIPTPTDQWQDGKRG